MKKEELQKLFPKLLPKFIQAVDKAKKKNSPILMSHTAFIETEQDLLLLALSVKYACKSGVQMIILPDKKHE